MQILTKSHSSDKTLFSGTSRITKTETGVLIIENRSTGADKRIKVHCVQLDKKEAYRAFRATINNKLLLKLLDLGKKLL